MKKKINYKSNTIAIDWAYKIVNYEKQKLTNN